SISDGLVRDALADLEPRLTRHAIPLGTSAPGGEIRIRQQGDSVLSAGPSGSGKSTLTSAMLERLMEAGYQICVVDPEGDYASLSGAIGLGDQEHAPSPEGMLG